MNFKALTFKTHCTFSGFLHKSSAVFNGTKTVNRRFWIKKSLILVVEVYLTRKDSIIADFRSENDALLLIRNWVSFGRKNNE